MAFVNYANCPQIKIDGKDVEELYKLTISGRPEIFTPEERLIEYELDGGVNGNIFAHTGWHNTEHVITFNYLEESGSNGFNSFKERFMFIRYNFMKTKILMYNDAPNLEYVVKRVVVESSQNDFLHYGIFTVRFICDPFGYMLDDPDTVLTGVQSGNNNNRGYQDCFPTITISGLVAGSRFKLIFKNNAGVSYWSVDCATGVPSLPNQPTKLVIDGRLRMMYYESATGVRTYPKNEIVMTQFPYVLKSEAGTYQSTSMTAGLTITIKWNGVK